MNIEEEIRKALNDEASAYRSSPVHHEGIRRRVLRRTSFYATSVVVTVALLAGAALQLPGSINGAPSGEADTKPAAGPSARPSETVSQEAGEGDQPNEVVETCGTRDYSDGMPSAREGIVPPDWRDESVVVGPLGLHQLDVVLGQPSRSYEPVEGDKYPGLAFYPIVEKGHRVTLEVHPRSRSFMSLLVNFTGSPGIRLQEGVERLTLEACPDADTDFTAAFVVTAERCATMNVYVDDSKEPQEVQLPFGTSECAPAE